MWFFGFLVWFFLFFCFFFVFVNSNHVVMQLDGRAASVFLGAVKFSLSDQTASGTSKRKKRKSKKKSIALTGRGAEAGSVNLFCFFFLFFYPLSPSFFPPSSFSQ